MAQVEAVSFGTELKVCLILSLVCRELEVTCAPGRVQARG